MSNKVTFGLEKVHVAFIGSAQSESIDITSPCTTDGEITVTVTADTLLGASSPASVVVPLASETHDTVAKVAAAIANTLNLDETISAVFSARASSGTVILAAKTVAANDDTLDIAITPGTTGVTSGTSTAVTTGTTGWQTPIHIPGAIGFRPSPQGETTTMYADNGPYFTYTSNNGYSAELEMALIPDDILAEMLGWQTDSNGLLVETADAQPKEFALLGQVLGDAKNRRFCYYRCKASRPQKEHATKAESVEPSRDVLSLTILPVEINGKNIVKSVLQYDQNPSLYEAWFDAVPLPTGV